MTMHLAMVNVRYEGRHFLGKYCGGPSRRGLRFFIDGRRVPQDRFFLALAEAKRAAEAAAAPSVCEARS